MKIRHTLIELINEYMNILITLNSHLSEYI